MFALRPFKNFVYDLRHPRDIYSCFRLLFIVAFVFGLNPFQVTKRRGTKRRELHTTVFGYLNMLICIFLASFCFLYNFLCEPSLVSFFFKTSVSHFTSYLQKFNRMLALTALMCLCLSRRRYFKKFISQFYDVEHRLLGVGITIRQTASTIRTNFVIVFLLSLNLLFIYHSNYNILKKHQVQVSFTTSMTFYSPNFIICVVTMLFCGALYKTLEYMRAVNRVLKNLGQQWENNTTKILPQKQRSLQLLDSFSMYTIVSKNPSEIVHESMEIHQLICEAANTANKYFTYQLLTIISIAFLIIVFDSYYVLETLLGKSKRESNFKTVEFVTFFSCQMILYLIAIISIVEGSNRAIKKSEKTGGIVHSLLNKAKDPEVKEQLKQFSMQLMHLKINFTAAGLFNIDRTLYFTISGALTTYLIILLQFTNASVPLSSTETFPGNDTNSTAAGA